MILTEVSPAAVEAVSLAEFKDHLRLSHGYADDGSEDTMLGFFLKSASSAVERRTGLALIARTFRLTVSAWGRRGQLVLPVGPVAAVDSISFVRDAETVALPSGSWHVQAGTVRQRVTGSQRGALPPVPAGYDASLVFDAGFGPAGSDVPGDIRQALILLAAHYYENRVDEGSGPGIPPAVAALLDTRRSLRV